MNGPINKQSLKVRYFSILLFLFVLIKGLNLSFIQMPFEGWDEYQHLAVAEFMFQHEKKPDYGDPLPETMYEFLLRHPHPSNSAVQLEQIGARNYDSKVWDQKNEEWADTPNNGSIQPKIYQSQHGPIYYNLLKKIRSFSSGSGYEAWADIARIFNVLFAAITLIIWIKVLTHYCTERSSYLIYLVCLMAASNSLYAYNYAHVANDSLAILLFSLSLLLFQRVDFTVSKIAYAYCFAIGIVIGLAVITKGTTLVLIPFILLMFVYLFIKKRDARYLSGLLVVSLGYLAMAGAYHAESLEKYGLITGMQEALVNRQNHKGVIDLIYAVTELNFSSLKGVFLYGHIQHGGWSDVRAEKWIMRLNQYFIWCVMIAVIVSTFGHQYRKSLVSRIADFFPLIILLLLTWAAMIFHGLQTLLAWGSMLTRAPYAMAVFPVFCLLLLALGSFSRRVTTALALLYILLFSMAYYSGLVNLLKLYSPNSSLNESIANVISHHSFIAQAYPIRTGFVIEIIMLAYLMYWVWRESWRSRS